MLEVCGHISQGLARKNCEDAFAINDKVVPGQQSYSAKKSFVDDKSPPLVCVADGLGGHPKGEVASKYALQKLWDICAKPQETFALKLALIEVHRATNRLANQDAGPLLLGTTIVGALLHNGTVTVFNVGDSRAYHLSKPDIAQVSVDDSGFAGAITQVIGGGNPDPDPHLVDVDLKEDEMLILVSDGVSGALGTDEIAEIALSSTANNAQQLCTAAKEAESGDDTTAIVVAKSTAK